MNECVEIEVREKSFSVLETGGMKILLSCGKMYPLQLG